MKTDPSEVNWEAVRAAMGKPTAPIALLGSTKRSLDKSLAKVRRAFEEAYKDREGSDD